MENENQRYTPWRYWDFPFQSLTSNVEDPLAEYVKTFEQYKAINDQFTKQLKLQLEENSKRFEQQLKRTELRMYRLENFIGKHVMIKEDKVNFKCKILWHNKFKDQQKCLLCEENSRHPELPKACVCKEPQMCSVCWVKQYPNVNSEVTCPYCKQVIASYLDPLEAVF